MKNLFLLIFVFLGLTISAQEYEVVSFDVQKTDLTARTNPRVDSNGRKCAVIKIYADDQIAAVRGAVIGEVTSTGMEKLLYMSHDAKAVELVFDHHYPLKIVFEDFGYPTITGQMTYVCKLISKAAIPQTDTFRPFVQSNVKAINYTIESVEDILTKAHDAYEKGDFKNAFSLYKSIPHDIDAQYHLGHMLNNGLGCETNYSEAIRWYKEASINGNSMASYELANIYGSMYRNGTEYEKYMKMAGDCGFTDAYYDLGLDLFYGHKGLRKDAVKAKQYIKKAANQNNKDAIAFLKLIKQ